MEKPTKCQVAKVVFLLILLLFTPLVSSSLRHSYLYFLLNILIIALGLEAGFLKAISAPHDNKRTPIAACPVAAPELDNAKAASIEACEGAPPHGALRPTVAMRKTAVVVKRVDPPRKGASLRRCPSMSKPSIFFIGGGGGEEGSGVRKEEIKWEGEMSKQELFVKAEDYIGNFYTQLRMQREESWKKIHG